MSVINEFMTQWRREDVKKALKTSFLFFNKIDHEIPNRFIFFFKQLKWWQGEHLKKAINWTTLLTPFTIVVVCSKYYIALEKNPRAQSYTSLIADLYQCINWSFLFHFSGALNGKLSRWHCSVLRHFAT